MSRLSLGQPVGGMGPEGKINWATNALKQIERWSTQLNGGAIDYNNAASGLDARNTQDAIDEILAAMLAAIALLQPLDADLTAVAASGIAAAWTTYTPTITASAGGAFTTVAGAGRYIKIGKTVLLQVSVVITTNGPAAGAVLATLPFTASANANIMVGREVNVTGFELSGFINVSATQVAIKNYDFTYPGGDGRTFYMSGVYEST